MSRGIVQASRAVRFGGALRPTPVVLKQSNPVPSVGIPGPTFSDRTSPAAPPGQAPTHPGYTHESTPITSAHPRDIPGVDGAAPASRVPGASTVAGQPHVEVHTLAEGAKIGGSDAIRPEERNVKNWGPNQRTPEFNELEGKRRPVLDGGSNEGGLGPDGKSRTFSTIACLQEAKPGSTSANENRAASTTRVSGVAPQTSTPSRPARRSRFPPSKEGAASLPTLEHFLMQNRFAALYRSFIRATRNIPNPDARREMIDWIRGDLEPARRVTDLVNLKDRLMLGHVQLKRLQGPVELVSASDVGGPAFGSFTPFRRSGDTSRSANSLDTSAS